MARTRPFSIRVFALSVALQLTAVLLLFRFVAPDTWARNVAAGLGPFAMVFLEMQMFTCFFEWGFHRYILHGRIHQWLSRFSRGHRHHHALTPIRIIVAPDGLRIVLNEYPITSPHQYEDATFPPYALAAFWVLFSPILIGLQVLAPDTPVILGGLVSIAWSMFAYEAFHSVEHFPYEWWERATTSPRWGWLWRRVYGFHHFHHANIATNEAISGFLGLPVADWVFRTYNQPPGLLLQGRLATAKMFAIRKPWPFVVRLDNWARARETAITHGH